MDANPARKNPHVDETPGATPSPSPETSAHALYREADLPGRLLFETAHTTIHQAAFRMPGYLIVTPKSAAETLGQLEPEALTDFFSALLLAETFVGRVLQPERIYLLKFAEFMPQLHMHVIPRTAFLGRAYERSTEETQPYDGAALTTWLWKHHLALSFSDDDLDLFVTRAREALS